MSIPNFVRLNKDWNAEPNAPNEKVAVGGATVRLTFLLNARAYEAEKDEKACLTFEQCSMWRLGPVNDEGWYSGQCRYSKTAPSWGEFYEVLGEDEQRLTPADWHKLTLSRPEQQRHFLFYLRDHTFECFAADWRFERGDLAP